MAQPGAGAYYYTDAGTGSGAPQPPPWPPTFMAAPPQPPKFHPQQAYEQQYDEPFQQSYSYHPPPAPQPPAFDLYGQPVHQPSYRSPPVPPAPFEYHQPSYVQPPGPPPPPVKQQARWDDGLGGAYSAGPNDFGPGSGSFVPPQSDQMSHRASFESQHGVVPISTGGLSANLLFAHSAPPPLPVEHQQQLPSGHRLPYFSPFLNSVVPELEYVSPPASPEIYLQTPTQPFAMPLAFPPLEPKFVPPPEEPSYDEDEDVAPEYEARPVAPAPSPPRQSLAAPPPAAIASPTPSFDFHPPPVFSEHEERHQSTTSIASEGSVRGSPTPPSLYSQEESYIRDQRRGSLEVPHNRRSLPKPPSPKPASTLPSPPRSQPSPPTQRTPSPVLEPAADSSRTAVPDNVVYSYALRVAILSDILSTQPTLSKSPTPSSSSLHPTTHPTSPPPLLARNSSTSSASSSKRRLKDLPGGKDVSALWNKSLTKSIDLIKEVSGAVDSFPKVALRPLETRLSRIAAGQDSKYPDRDFQAAVAEFQNKLVGEPFRSRFKKEGNIDELIGVFAASAQLALRKSHPDTAWVDLLDPLIGQFAIAVRDCLRSLNVSGEVITRLDGHAQKFGGGASATSMRRGSSASGHGDASGTVGTAPHEGTTLNVSRMRMVQIVGRLFGQSQDDLVEDVNELRHRCTEKAAYNDLRRCINNVAQGAKFPANRSDFDSDASYQQWRKEENTELSRLLFEMLSRHPSLRGADDDLSGALVFVPSDVPGTYRRLVDFALGATPESDGIMSSDQQELLQACASRWRVTTPAQVNALLAGVVRCEAPMPYVDEALDALEIAESPWPYDRWPWADRLALYASLRALFDGLLPRLAKIFQGVLQLPFEKIIDPLERIYSNEVFREDSRDLSAVLEHLRGSVTGLVARGYAAKSTSTNEKLADDPPEKALEPLLLMLEWLMGECKRYSKAFPRPLFDTIDVPSIFIGTAAPLWVVDLEAAQGALSAVATRAPGAASDDDLLVLYENTKKLKKMHDAFCGAALVIPFAQLFGAYVRRWISGSAETMSKVWVTRAIDQDKFEVDLDGEQRHSSSVTDIVEGCKASIRSLLALEWPDEVESAQYNTRLSQAIANAIQIYARSLEEVFVNEINPPSEEIGEENWFTKARLAVQGGKKLVPFRFELKLLVKLNNVAAMRLLLDGLSASLDAEKIGPLLEKHGSQIPPERLRNLFTVKIVHGERLIAADGSRGKVDSFVAIADEVGYQIARTRTAHETNNPRYEQSFDVLVKELPLVVSVYRPLSDESPEVIGRARFNLNPSDFTPLVRRDLLLPLEGAHRQAAPSRILVRVRMEPEKDDIRFYFGRAFRALKRTEKEMARMVVGKMLPLIREYLSMSTLRTLLRTNLTNLIDLDRARGNLTTASRTVQGAALSLGARVNALLDTTPQQLIPDVIDHTALPAAPADGAERRGLLTPQEVQLQAIAPLEPLVDYLNDQLAILAESLSPDAWALVSEQLWREVLATVEGLILPPLSDEPTDKKPLTEKELDVIFRWLHFLVEFFHADGEGLDMTILHGIKYRDLTLARMYYDMPTAELRAEVVQSTQRQLQKSPSLLGRSKSVLNQRNLKAIEEVKTNKVKEMETSNAPVILRILRVRPGQGDFVTEQLAALNDPVAANPAQRREAGGQGRRAAALARSPPAAGGHDALPPMPSLRDTK